MAGSGNIYELRKWMYMHRDANGRVTKEYLVWKHLINRGFTPNYYIWFQHGEGYNYDQNESSSSNSNFQEEPVDHHLHNEHSYHQEEMVDYDRVHDMVADAFVAHDEDEEPNIDAKKFYETKSTTLQWL